MTAINVKFFFFFVERWAPSKKSAMGVRRFGFREVMELLLLLRQEKGTTDTFQVTDHITA
jgi:hypothetical protein